MSENCDNKCGSCSEDCADRTQAPGIPKEKLNEMSRIGKVIGVISGKGGVGKSMVTSLLAVHMNRRGFRTAILDADVTGPSIPKVLGLKQKAMSNEAGLFPVKSRTGIDVMSINLLLEKDTDPVLWRGPLIGGLIKQFWTDVFWNDIDYMFIDMPPGTGDVALTVFQSLDVDGIVVVTSPQELVSMIVSKAVIMAEKMDVPILGIVENMSYFQCPDCGSRHAIFGDSHVEEIAEVHGLPVLARIPMDPAIAAASDAGTVEMLEGEWLKEAADRIETYGEETKMKIAVACENDQVTEHFGHCEGFLLFDAEDDKILDSTFVENPGHRPGFLPNFLNDLGVRVVISGGMGGGAIEIFNEKGIEVVTGAAGPAREAAELYVKGLLTSTGSVCHDHQHSHDAQHDHQHSHECGGH